MKVIIVSLLWLSSSFALAAEHPASLAVRSIIVTGQQILALKSEAARNQQFCALVNDSLAVRSVGFTLLGDFSRIGTDKPGVELFFKQVPSLMTTKLIGLVGRTAGATVDVSPDATDRHDSTYEVDVTLHTGAGNVYSAKIIMAFDGQSYRLVDGFYRGFSAVNYIARDVQNHLQDAVDANSKTPVSDYVKSLLADPKFINCLNLKPQAELESAADQM